MKKHTIKIYTSPGCHYCHLATDFLREKKIKFEELSVEEEKNAEESVRKSGQYGVPVIEIDGKIIVGFDREEIEKLIG